MNRRRIYLPDFPKNDNTAFVRILELMGLLPLSSASGPSSNCAMVTHFSIRSWNTQGNHTDEDRGAGNQRRRAEPPEAIPVYWKQASHSWACQPLRHFHGGRAYFAYHGRHRSASHLRSPTDVMLDLGAINEGLASKVVAVDAAEAGFSVAVIAAR